MNCKSVSSMLALIPVIKGIESVPSDMVSHVRTCTGCQSMVRERARLDRLLEYVGEIDPPEGFVPRILQRAAAKPVEQRGSGLRLVVRMAAAAALVAAALGGAFYWAEYGSPSGEKNEANGSAGLIAANPDLLANLDLFLDDWEEVQEYEEDLDLVASLEMAAALQALDEEATETPR